MSNLPDSTVDALAITFKAERCVHAIIINGSCTACEQICPLDAIELRDSRLDINSDLCDSCGLCAAVCPEQAIEHEHTPRSIQWHDEQIALMACEKAYEGLSGYEDGKVSCIHAFSLSDLLKLYQSGHRKLLVATAPCETCTRGTQEHLGDCLSRLDLLLAAKNKPKLERTNISIEQYLNIIRTAGPEDSGVKLSRRKLFRRAATKLNDYSQAAATSDSDEDARITPIGKHLEKLDAKIQRLPYVPVINDQSCTTCDTCIKLCPHEALLIEQEHDKLAYKIDAANCTGCNICVDICEYDAIEVKTDLIVDQTQVALESCICEICRFSFHTLESKPSRLCPICEQKKLHSPLFQVLD